MDGDGWKYGDGHVYRWTWIYHDILYSQDIYRNYCGYLLRIYIYTRLDDLCCAARDISEVMALLERFYDPSSGVVQAGSKGAVEKGEFM